jgi:hypothetical protein
MERLTEWTPEQLIYVDESACINERTSDRKYGWASIGLRASIIGSYKRSERWSILPAYTCNGFIDWAMMQGSYNADLFLNFIENHVLPHMMPFPGLRSVLIMDNARIHRDEVYISYFITADYREFKICVIKPV